MSPRRPPVRVAVRAAARAAPRLGPDLRWAMLALGLLSAGMSAAGAGPAPLPAVR